MKGEVQYFLGQRLAAVISWLHSGDITSGERARERERERKREREKGGGGRGLKELANSKRNLCICRSKKKKKKKKKIYIYKSKILFKMSRWFLYFYIKFRKIVSLVTIRGR